MGRKRHSTAEEVSIIKKMKKDGMSLRNISQTVGCSLGKVQNALKNKEAGENRGRPRKTTHKTDRRIISEVKKDPFLSSGAILKDLNLNVSARTIRRRLNENNLSAKSPRKVPLLNKKQLKLRVEFAKKYKNWSGVEGSKKWHNIFWTDECKFNLYGSDGRSYVRRPPNSEYDPRYTKKTVKHGGGNIMVWAGFSWHGVGPIHLIEGIMTKEVYINILETELLPYAEDNLPLIWTLQADFDPKHTAKNTKDWITSNKIRVLPWPSQSPDLNPIENLWKQVKDIVAAKKPKNKNQLWKEVKAAWESIPLTMCRKLVDSMPKRCVAVLKNKGHSSGY